MSFCKCGHCQSCKIQLNYPEAVPPVQIGPLTFAAASTPKTKRYIKCPKCGADMDKRVPCAPCEKKSGKAVSIKVCPKCGE